MFKRFIAYYKPHKKILIPDLISSFLIAIIGIGYPVITRSMLNNWIPNRNITFIIIGSVSLILIYFVRALLRYFVQYYGHVMGANIEYDMRAEIFEHYQKLSFSFAIGKQLFARSRYYIVSSMMVTVFSQTDKIMIKTMINDSANGYYSAAITCAAMTGFVFSALIDSLRPVIFESNKISEERFEKNMARLYSLIIYMGLAQSVVLTLLANPIIGVLYGKDYLPSVPLLQIITWYSAFSYMGSVRNIWMLAKEKQKYLWVINLMGAALNVAGNFALIPLLGASGAAIASVATQFFTNFILCLIFKPIKPTTRLIVRALNPKTIIEMIPRKENKNVK